MLNILDIVALVSIILSGEVDPLGDLNGDGSLNILDVVRILNVILG